MAKQFYNVARHNIKDGKISAYKGANGKWVLLESRAVCFDRSIAENVVATLSRSKSRKYSYSVEPTTFNPSFLY